MRSLPRFSVRYPTTVLMLILAILLLGYLSFERLGMDLFPDLQNPRLFVEVTAGDRPPEEMERQFVTDLEAAAVRGRGVAGVSTVIQTGRALITVEYGWGRVDMDEAFLDLQKTMADQSQRQEDLDEVTVSQHDPNAVPVVVAALYHPQITDLDALRQTAEGIIRTELIRLPGVAAVELVGERRREVEVLVDAYTLEAYGLTVEQLKSTIEGANRNMTGGSIVEMGRRYVIKGVGELTSADELNDLIVTQKTPETPLRPGQDQSSSDQVSTEQRVPVSLREVAQVRVTLSEPENMVRLDGRRCIGLEIYKEARYNTIDAAESIHEHLEILRHTLPGYEIEIVQDQARFIEAAVTEVEQTGLIGIALAVLVLFVFLRRVGLTAVVSIGIPISIVATFNLMYFGDLSLNLMTLGGLALGAGMLVDNAIVVVESIFRKLEGGSSLTEAAIEGTAEVGGAITSSTLTTIIVFLPIVYLHGAAGELFREQAWTVAFSLVSSLFVALSVIPMLCSRLLSKTRVHGGSAVHFPRYAGLLGSLIARKGLVVLATLVMIGVTAASLSRLGSEFMPRAGRGEVAVELSLPEGTHLERTEGVVRNLEAFLLHNFADHLSHVYSRVGPTGTASAGSGGDALEVLADESTAVIHILFSPAGQLSAADLISALGRELAGLPDIEAQFAQQETALEISLGRTSAPLVIEIKGKELPVLTRLAVQVQERLAMMSELTNVETTAGQGRPQIDVEIDRTRAAQHSMEISAIGTQLQHLLSGREAGQLQQQGEYTDIMIRRPRLAVQDLENVMLEAPEGRKVRLDEVARLVPTLSPRAITRNDQVRTTTVSAELNSDLPFDRVVARVEAELTAMSWPPEYNFSVTGEEQLRQEAFESLRFALLLAVVMVYMVMAAQFESLVHPFVILLTIPLAGVGAVVLLMALSMPLNVMSFIGIIMLTGISVNDSIILVDRINQNRRGGQHLTEAIINAGQTRIRPIVMTSVTTMLALLPLAIGAGEGAALRAPMAIAVIGGLVTSTALSLVVIPCAYHLLARFDRLRVTPA
jgi:HAE1 family hydrophobic/amphiphilic exporter-1